MSLFILPLTNVPQTFEMALGAIDYIITCKWNDSADAGWVLDFVNALNNTPVVYNIPLITGANLLSGLDYLGFTGSLIVYTDGDELATPTLLNLGVESNVYFQTEDA